MTTIDERREIAARLREYAAMTDQFFEGTLAQFYIEKVAFGNVERHGDCDLFARLADLIEPGCDRDALLELADAVHGMGVDCDAKKNYAFGCTLRAIAERIREAVGA